MDRISFLVSLSDELNQHVATLETPGQRADGKSWGEGPSRLSILSKNRYRTTNRLHLCAISLTDDDIAGAQSTSGEAVMTDVT